MYFSCRLNRSCLLCSQVGYNNFHLLASRSDQTCLFVLGQPMCLFAHSQINFICFAFEQYKKIQCLSSAHSFKTCSLPSLTVSVNICLPFELTQISWLEIKIFSYQNRFFSGNKFHVHGNSRIKSSCIHCGPQSILCIISDVFAQEICIPVANQMQNKILPNLELQNSVFEAKVNISQLLLVKAWRRYSHL